MNEYNDVFKHSRVTMEDHDRFVRSNKRLALAEEPIKRDHKGLAIRQENKSCRNCGLKRSCKKNKIKKLDGVVSVGGNAEELVCDKWEENKDNPKIRKFNKSLLKQYRKLARY